jgi:hypothetical protein
MNKSKSEKSFPLSKPLNRWAFKIKQLLKKNLLLIAILTSVVCGISVGFLLRQFYVLDEQEIKYFGFPGAIFLRLIKLFILPLIAFRYNLQFFLFNSIAIKSEAKTHNKF